MASTARGSARQSRLVVDDGLGAMHSAAPNSSAKRPGFDDQHAYAERFDLGGERLRDIASSANFAEQ